MNWNDDSWAVVASLIRTLWLQTLLRYAHNKQTDVLNSFPKLYITYINWPEVQPTTLTRFPFKYRHFRVVSFERKNWNTITLFPTAFFSLVFASSVLLLFKRISCFCIWNSYDFIVATIRAFFFPFFKPKLVLCTSIQFHKQERQIENAP